MAINNPKIRKILFFFYLAFIKTKTKVNCAYVYKNQYLINLLEERFVNHQYRSVFNKNPDLHFPQTFNEKIQWLKLYGERNSAFTNLVDKLSVREFVGNRIGEKYLTNLLGVYDDVRQINYEKLPDKFVLRLNHGSGWNIICKDKQELNWIRAQEKLERWINSNYYDISKEWVYRDIKPKILCESFLSNDLDYYGDESIGLLDYKFFCFDQEPQFVQVDIDRYSDHKRNFYDLNWVKQPFTTAHSQYAGHIPQPQNFEEMKRVVKELCPKYPFARVDLYNLQGKIYFGEITFFQEGGHGAFFPDEYDVELGKLIKLPLSG